MPDATLLDPPERWPERLRRAPTGILVIAALLAVLALGSVAAGLVLLLQDGEVSLWAVATGLLGGPAILYLTFHLVRLARWTWTTLVVLLVLLAASSLLRLAMGPGLGIAPVGELIVEGICALYLTRPSIRRLFASPERPGGGVEALEPPAG